MGGHSHSPALPTTAELEKWAAKKGIKFTPKYPPKGFAASLEKMPKYSAIMGAFAATFVVTTFVWSVMMSGGKC